ncbi:hypothetical protein J6590_042544 [Homalodisca vitripennis]|nr:hypothetical protein J6590_042544 [Homalodisca vitripennis]
MPETWKSWHGPLLRASDLWTEEEDRLLWLQDQEYQTECRNGFKNQQHLDVFCLSATRVRRLSFNFHQKVTLLMQYVVPAFVHQLAIATAS